MALVHASDTASFRSSILSSGRLRREDATEETTRRAMAMYSGRAGISSSRISSMGGYRQRLPTMARSRQRSRHCRRHGLVDGEDLGQPGDLEHLQDARLGAYQPQVTLVAAQPLEPPHQHTEARGVEEIDPVQVDDDLQLPLVDQLDQLLPQAGGGIDVHFALDDKNDVRGVAVVYLEAKIHSVAALLDRRRSVPAAHATAAPQLS